VKAGWAWRFGQLGILQVAKTAVRVGVGTDNVDSLVGAKIAVLLFFANAGMPPVFFLPSGTAAPPATAQDSEHPLYNAVHPFTGYGPVFLRAKVLTDVDADHAFTSTIGKLPD
jgi:hypothetical protein